MITPLHLRRRSVALGSAFGIGAAALVAVAAPSAQAAAGAACRMDRTLDTVTYTCPDDGHWYAAVVQCLGTRKVGNGQQTPFYIVGDSPRPMMPMTIECTGDGKQGVVFNSWTEGPF
ncbi:hypothetical protein LTV02_06915 [Nocardia yamanashiensis]|uniref:hypothetical protein n=1 Tax=Nocardia yamanashiensis TaxID=209247 RepID=UPI000A6AE66F|nr:hypothetical protein [Nocardia yamanashiensis]UGT43115.1 hypothetical protein LTV02_06915 [Nocardia yamanashiensis]